MPDLRGYAREAASRAGCDPDLFERQIQQESGFDPDAFNPASGAAGIAQLVPRFHPGVDPRDPLASLEYAARWMASLHQQYGTYRRALAAYNWGPGNVAGWDGRSVTLPADTRHYLDVILGPGWPEPSERSGPAAPQPAEPSPPRDGRRGPGPRTAVAHRDDTHDVDARHDRDRHQSVRLAPGPRGWRWWGRAAAQKAGSRRTSWSRPTMSRSVTPPTGPCDLGQARPLRFDPDHPDRAPGAGLDLLDPLHHVAAEVDRDSGDGGRGPGRDVAKVRHQRGRPAGCQRGRDRGRLARGLGRDGVQPGAGLVRRGGRLGLGALPWRLAGHTWGHWTAVRGRTGDDASEDALLMLANPGGTGPTLRPADAESAAVRGPRPVLGGGHPDRAVSGERTVRVRGQDGARLSRSTHRSRQRRQRAATTIPSASSTPNCACSFAAWRTDGAISSGVCACTTVLPIWSAVGRLRQASRAGFGRTRQ